MSVKANSVGGDETLLLFYIFITDLATATPACTAMVEDLDGGLAVYIDARRLEW